MSNKPVALTGASGFLGSHILEALTQRTIPVNAVVRNPHAILAASAERHVAELSDVPGLTRAFYGCRAVIANAALGSFQGTLSDFQRVNIDGTQNVLHAAISADVERVILVSTVAVCRTQVNTLLDETAIRYGQDGKRGPWQVSDLTTDWRYAVTKSVAEDRARDIARKAGLKLTILRPGPVFGARDPKLTQRYLRQWRQPIAFAVTAGVPHVSAPDVAQAACQALERPESIGNTYVLAGPPTSPYEVLRTLRQLTGKGPRLIPIPIPIWVGWNTHAAERDLGFRVTPLTDALAPILHHENEPIVTMATTAPSKR